MTLSVLSSTLSFIFIMQVTSQLIVAVSHTTNPQNRFLAHEGLAHTSSLSYVSLLQRPKLTFTPWICSEYLLLPSSAPCILPDLENRTLSSLLLDLTPCFVSCPLPLRRVTVRMPGGGSVPTMSCELPGRRGHVKSSLVPRA